MRSSNSVSTSCKQSLPRVMVVDDHPLVRAGIVDYVQSSGVGEVIAELSDAREIVAQVQRAKPDVIIMDVSMPHVSGITATRQVKAQFPDIKILALSSYDEEFYAPELLKAGANGYVMKSEPPPVVLHALGKVLSGEIYLSDKIGGRLLQQLSTSPSSRSPSLIDGLSARQLEVFTYLGQGHSTRSIAEQMQIRPKTVETFRSQIQAKLCITQNDELLRQARAWAAVREYGEKKN